MVRDEIWAVVGAGESWLCVGCLERRLGRELRPDDFTDVFVNEPSPWDTPRLASRKGGLFRV